jgi:ribosomal protein L23
MRNEGLPTLQEVERELREIAAKIERLKSRQDDLVKFRESALRLISIRHGNLASSVETPETSVPRAEKQVFKGRGNPIVKAAFEILSTVEALDVPSLIRRMQAKGVSVSEGNKKDSNRVYIYLRRRPDLFERKHRGHWSVVRKDPMESASVQR